MLEFTSKSSDPASASDGGRRRAALLALNGGLVFTDASHKRLRKGWGSFVLDPAGQEIDVCLALSGSVSMARDILVARGIIPEWVTIRRLGAWLAQRRKAL